MQKYKIVRYYHPDTGKKKRVMKKNLTLQEAQKHCQSPKTKGKTYFDGFTKQ